MQALIGEARKSFRSVRLRAENDAAARLYERIGFIEINNPDATHILHFDSEQAAKSGVPE
jgi:predicted GNAT family acetyltransferase